MDFQAIMSPRAKERPAIGLIVLSTDERLEVDFRKIFRSDEADFFVSRIAMHAQNTPENLKAMAADLTASAALFPTSVEFDAIGYGCTSASAAIGNEEVSRLIKNGVNTPNVTNPLLALLTACKALNAQNIALLSPYGASTTARFIQALKDAGLGVVANGSFNQEQEKDVPRISSQSLYEAGLALAQSQKADALFLSCTNLDTLEVIPKLEAALSIPVMSSNQLLAWNLAKLTGLSENRHEFGRIWQF